MHKFHSNKIFQNQLCCEFELHRGPLDAKHASSFSVAMEGRNSLFSFIKNRVFLQAKDHIHFFFFCCPFSITKEPSEILVIGSDYWVTLYLVIITFLSKATSHLTTWSSNSILNIHTFLQPMVSLLPCQSWVLYIFF